MSEDPCSWWACFLLCLNHEPKLLETLAVKILWSPAFKCVPLLLPGTWSHYQPGVLEMKISTWSILSVVVVWILAPSLQVGRFMIRSNQGGFLSFFFFPPLLYTESRARQASIHTISFCEAAFLLIHWECCLLGSPSFMQQSQIDFTLYGLPSFVSILLSPCDFVNGIASRLFFVWICSFSHFLASHDFLSV